MRCFVFGIIVALLLVFIFVHPRLKHLEDRVQGLENTMMEGMLDLKKRLFICEGGGLSAVVLQEMIGNLNEGFADNTTFLRI